VRSTIYVLMVLVILSAGVGCGGTEVASTPLPTSTPQPTITPALLQLQSGVYVTNDVSTLPLVTSGYELYVLGEAHGEQEMAELLLSYLADLHATLGLCDVILEEDQVYEQEANDYVLGITDTLRVDLCLRANVLTGIRSLNSQLADDERIRIHLADLDSPLLAIHLHLQRLHQQLGPGAESIQMPTPEEFKAWTREALGKHMMVDLVEQLEGAAGDRDSILAELGNVRLSLDYYYAGNRIGIGPPEGTVWNAPIREDGITHNIEHLLRELEGAPALAFFGSAHAMKSEGVQSRVPGLQSWAHRLVDSGVEVYSLRAWSLSGRSYWRGTESEVTGNGSQIQFADGSSLATVLEAAPDAAIVYVDLRSEANASTRLGDPFLDVPARTVYDGLVVFREVQPMDHTCP
jgi:hypothetical protein